MPVSVVAAACATTLALWICYARAESGPVSHRPTIRQLIANLRKRLTGRFAHEEPDWVIRTFKDNKRNRLPGHVRLAPCYDITLAGTGRFRRIKDRIRFIREAEPGRAQVVLLREAANREHPEALQALGSLAERIPTIPLGKVPEETAALLGEVYGPQMPFAAQIRRMGYLPSTGAYFISLSLTAPIEKLFAKEIALVKRNHHAAFPASS